MTLGDKINELREEKRISIRGLGRLTDVSGMHISNLEKGKVNASPELITKIADALETNVDELLHLADRVDPEVVDVIQNKLCVATTGRRQTTCKESPLLLVLHDACDNVCGPA